MVVQPFFHHDKAKGVVANLSLGKHARAQLRVFMNAHWNDKGMFLEGSRRRHVLRVESRLVKGMHCIACIKQPNRAIHTIAD